MNPSIHDVRLPPRSFKDRAETRLLSAIALDALSQGGGGARRDRTDDLMLAKHALSQLSYGPVCRDLRRSLFQGCGRPGQTRTADLTLIRRTL